MNSTQITTRQFSWRDAELMRQQGMHPVLARLYAARGAVHEQDRKVELADLLPPAGLAGIQRAAEFLADAIRAQKRLVIVADYDCDGATACAIGLRGLRMMGAEVDYIVPNRFEYGYGLTPEIVQLCLREKQPDIIITVDNGIASVDGVDAANQAGLQVVVTDHHLPGASLPNAAVIVNPNQPECHFQSKHLAGVGVMFYVLLALRAEFRRRGDYQQETQPRLDSLLDLVALGTVADVVKLDSNNRILVAQGLKRMRAGKVCPGIAALFRVAGRDTHKASPFDLGFALGPRLNAAGRLADMSLGIECLCTDDASRAWEIAQQLHAINAERKEIERDMQDLALLHLDQFTPSDSYTIAVFDESWHQGVIGIVASRLKDKFFRPTITFAPGGDDLIKGSGRSIPGFHLRDALDLVAKAQPDLLHKFGGHAMAAGLTLNRTDFERFQAEFEQVARKLLTPDQLHKIIETDGALEAEYYSLDFINLLDSVVWGQGFPPPLFYDKFYVINQRILKERHLKLTLEKDGRQFDAIWFGHAEPVASTIDVVFRLDINEYNGNSKIQLMIEHIH